MTHLPVLLRPADADGALLSSLPDDLPVDVAAALALAARLGAAAPRPVPGDGGTSDLWSVLATLAAHDLGVARAVEPHLDALAILTQAGDDVPAGVWGVFAAEGGDDPLIATPDAGAASLAGTAPAGWSLTGTKPWCSLADRLDAGLITAALADGSRRLFAVTLRDDTVAVAEGAWHSRGLTEIPSGPVHFAGTPARQVGEPGWYLTRPGFEWGGIGVAACWYGGAVGIARAVHAQALRRDNPFLVMHLGAIDEALHAARLALVDAADAVDANAGDDRIRAKRVRGIVARACEEVLLRAGHALGPAPLALDEAHAKRVADLTVYVRQHHAERDQESLGRALLTEGGPAPW